MRFWFSRLRVTHRSSAGLLDAAVCLYLGVDMDGFASIKTTCSHGQMVGRTPAYCLSTDFCMCFVRVVECQRNNVCYHFITDISFTV